MKRPALLHICLLLLLVTVGAASAQSDVTTYVETARIGRGYIDQLFWSPDGATLAATTSRGIWFYQSDNLTVPPRLLEIDSQPQPSETSHWLFRYPVVAFDADWQRVAIDEQQYGVTIRDVGTGEILTHIERDPERIYQSFTFSPDGRTLAASVRGFSTLDIDFYDSLSGALVRTFQNEDLFSAALLRYSPDGHYLVIQAQLVGGDFMQQAFYILDSESGEIAFSESRSSADAPTPELDVPPVVVGSYTDAPLLALGLPAMPFSLRLLEDRSAFALSSDATAYLTHDNETVLLKDAATDEVITTFPAGTFANDPHAAAFDPQNARIAYADSRNHLIIVSTTDPYLIDYSEYGCPAYDERCLTATDAHALTVPELETIIRNGDSASEAEQYISPDGRWLVKLGWQEDNIIHVTRTADDTAFPLEPGDPLPVLEPREPGDTATEGRHDPNIRAARVSPDGHWLALGFTTSYHDGSADRVVRVYDVSGAEPIAEPVAQLLHTSSPTVLAFSPDSQTLASSNSYDNEVLLWNTSSWEQTAALLHTNRVTQMAFTDTGDLLTFDLDGILHIWSPQ